MPGASNPFTGKILQQPQPMPPATVYALLGRGQTQLLHQAALVGLWSLSLLRRGLAALDRPAASGKEDTILVRNCCWACLYGHCELGLQH